MKAIIDYFKTDTSTPVDELSAAQEKISELDSKITGQKTRLEKLQADIQAALVDDAFGAKGAEQLADKLTADFLKLEAQLEASKTARARISEEFDTFKEAKAEYEKAQAEQAIKDQAKADLKELAALKKKLEKSQTSYVQDLAAMAKVSRQAASAFEDETNKSLRVEYKEWRGFLYFETMSEYHYLTEYERAELQLKQICERGLAAKEPENRYEPSEAEKQAQHEADIRANVSARYAERSAFNDFNKPAA